jgi:hypothetical protein
MIVEKAVFLAHCTVWLCNFLPTFQSKVPLRLQGYEVNIGTHNPEHESGKLLQNFGKQLSKQTVQYEKQVCKY